MASGARPARHNRQASKNSSTTTGAKQDAAALRKLQHEERDEATIEYVKGILCATTNVDDAGSSLDRRRLSELLPHLTSDSQIDIQLYGILAVILSQFVQAWYNKITPDATFVREVVQVISHCIRELEKRLRSIDLEVLLLDELPSLLDAHLEAIETARRAAVLHDNAGTNDETLHISVVYHALRPHSALSPLPTNEDSIELQRSHEAVWSQTLINEILPLLLPPEDLVNPCLNVLVSEIFSDLILRNAVLGKLSEPWLLWDATTKLIHAFKPNIGRSAVDVSPSPTNRLDQFGLLAGTEAGGVHTDSSTSRHGMLDSLALMFWSILQNGVMLWSLLRALAIALMNVRSSPQPLDSTKETTEIKHKGHADASDIHPLVDPEERHTPLRRPIISMAIWSCANHVTSLARRMPWFTGLLSLIQWWSLYGPGSICGRNSTIDRLLSEQIRRKLDTTTLLQLLRSIRSAAFPDNTMAPGRVPPAIDEIAIIKHDCATAIIDTMPEIVRWSYFTTKDRDLMQKDVERTLDFFESSYINKHLIVGALELIVIRLFPELAIVADSTE